jgi:glutaredoxin
MNKVTIFGKPDCQRCELAKRLIPEAEYRHHSDLYDLYPVDDATGIVTASGGNLPIIIIEGFAGRLVLGPSAATAASKCDGDTCTIPTAKESNVGQGNAKQEQS